MILHGLRAGSEIVWRVVRCAAVPVEFLSDEQAAAYGRFDGEWSRSELERFFFLDDV
jgi:hypothetical protein